MISIVIAGVGASIGSVVRFLTLEWGRKYVHTKIPWVTLSINLIGTFSLGFLMLSHVKSSVTLFIGSGIIGGFTTFSTFMSEMVLLNKNDKKSAFLYGLLTIGIGLIFGLIGMYIGSFYYYFRYK